MTNKKPEINVSELNKKLQDEEMTPKQREKAEKKAKEYWNGMVSRREVAELVKEQGEFTNQQMQYLFVQNRTLLEILAKKGIATDEEINEHSKEVLESLFNTGEDKKE